MMLPNPLNPNEAYVLSREEYILISIRHGMFIMLRAVTKINIMHVQIHQITTLLMGQRPSTLDGPCFARLASCKNILSVNGLSVVQKYQTKEACMIMIHSPIC